MDHPPPFSLQKGQKEGSRVLNFLVLHLVSGLGLGLEQSQGASAQRAIGSPVLEPFVQATAVKEMAAAQLPDLLSLTDIRHAENAEDLLSHHFFIVKIVGFRFAIGIGFVAAGESEVCGERREIE